MPIYEFYCPNNNRIYSFLARTLAYAGKTPRCPDNPKFKLERVVSRFAVTGRAKEKPDAPPGGGPEDDPRMDVMMAEMEREFSGMDEENPDPRQLARMMRKMSSITGEKMPAEMEEMIGRMEKGEDPEKLEEEYGDAFGDDPEGGGPGMPGMPGMPGAESEGAEPADEKRSTMKRLLRARRAQAQRDPTLYDMGDYVK